MVAADVENFRLLDYRQIVPAVEHRFALGTPALVIKVLPSVVAKSLVLAILLQ